MITIISGAFAPGLALLSFIYLKDKYELEPFKIILKMFILGSIIVFPAYVLERTLQEGISQLTWYSNLFNIAVIEEFLKWFVLYFFIYKHIEFDEPYDGVVYSVSVAIGFATIENLGFLIFQSNEPTIILLRALLPVSSHAVFAIIMGYFMGRAKFSKVKEKQFLVISLFIPIVSHNIYNFILSQRFTKWTYLMLPFLITLWVYGLRKIKIANTLSPFKNKEVS